jgi:NADP oxidoreductase coenzyme F420-dependent
MAFEAIGLAQNAVAEATESFHGGPIAGREQQDLRLGIIGAGKLGTTIARGAIAAGYDVAISGSGPADDIALTIDVLAPGARAVTTDEAVRHADIFALAVPTHRFRELPRDLFAGKILIDAMNFWEPVDGVDQELAAAADGGKPARTAICVRSRRTLFRARLYGDSSLIAPGVRTALSRARASASIRMPRLRVAPGEGRSGRHH